MERTQTGLVRQSFDGQVSAEIGVDEFHDPPEALGVECAADNRQRYRCRIQVGMMSQDLNAKSRRQGFDQHLASRRGVEHLSANVPRNPKE